MPSHVDGLVEVLIDATGNPAPLAPERLWGWHAALFPTGYSGLRKIKVAGWREGDEGMQVVSGPIGKPTVRYEAPDSERVPAEMERFFGWWERAASELDGIVRAGVAHFWFVTIHPFDDGNGRIARALTDLALAQREGETRRYYSMSAEICAERATYYERLERCQRGSGDITRWLVWFLETFTKAMKRSEGVVESVHERARFWAAHEGVELNERQRKAIGKMVEKGRGGFASGMTNKKYVAIAKTSFATATRDLAGLVEKGLFVRGPARERGTFYELVWPEG